MQVSSVSSGSAAWAVRELFSPPQQASGQALPTARQSLPGASMTSVGGASMSAAMLGSLIQMQGGGQTGAPSGSRPGGPPPGGAAEASDAASTMISDLDTNGDGVVSLEEASASGSGAATEAFGVLDADGDGSLTQEEVTSALEEMGPPRGGAPPGGGASMTSTEIGAQILADFDTDQSQGLSLGEVSSALTGSEEARFNSAFSSLDSDGDGQLSLSELTVALESYLTRTTATATHEAVAA